MNLVKSIVQKKNLLRKTRAWKRGIHLSCWVCERNYKNKMESYIFKSSQSDLDRSSFNNQYLLSFVPKYINPITSNVSMCFSQIQRPYMTNAGCCIVSSKHMNNLFLGKISSQPQADRNTSINNRDIAPSKLVFLATNNSVQTLIRICIHLHNNMKS